jgi:hypothetical protein
MSIVAVVLVLALLAALAVALAVVVHRDGYGTLTPPTSQRSWDDGTSVAVQRAA